MQNTSVDRRTIASGILGFLVGVIAVVTVTGAVISAYGVGVILAQQETTAQIAEDIRSCTTPGEPCHKRSQHATAEAVASIIAAQEKSAAQASAAASACVSEGKKRYLAIYKCVLRKLSQK